MWAARRRCERRVLREEPRKPTRRDIRSSPQERGPSTNMQRDVLLIYRLADRSRVGGAPFTMAVVEPTMDPSLGMEKAALPSAAGLLRMGVGQPAAGARRCTGLLRACNRGLARCAGWLGLACCEPRRRRKESAKPAESSQLQHWRRRGQALGETVSCWC
jgi:hypothetical protein